MKITIKPKPAADAAATSPPEGGLTKPALLSSDVLANRETYLQAAVEYFRPYFRDYGKTEIPLVRVSCGFPGGRASKKITGACWDADSADDKRANIFISPLYDESRQVLHTLAHELVHACVGFKARHGPLFRKLASALDMRGKMTATYSGATLENYINHEIIGALGNYPHSKLNLDEAPIKKQGTRMIKCYCKLSGYTVRTTKQWLDKYGPPISPVNQTAMEVEWPDEDEDTVIPITPAPTTTAPSVST